LGGGKSQTPTWGQRIPAGSNFTGKSKNGKENQKKKRKKNEDWGAKGPANFPDRSRWLLEKGKEAKGKEGAEHVQFSSKNRHSEGKKGKKGGAMPMPSPEEKNHCKSGSIPEKEERTQALALSRKKKRRAGGQ